MSCAERERMDILFDEFPELKEAFDLKEEFRKLYWSKRDKEEYKDSLPAILLECRSPGTKYN